MISAAAKQGRRKVPVVVSPPSQARAAVGEISRDAGDNRKLFSVHEGG